MYEFSASYDDKINSNTDVVSRNEQLFFDDRN